MVMNSLRLSSRPPAVKAHTLSFAPEGWFSVKDYLCHTVGELVPGVVAWRTWPLLELAERRLPTEKTLSMRLLRYWRQGLLERKREGHRFLYKATRKGKLRGVFLKKHYRSIYEYLPHASFKHVLAKASKGARLPTPSIMRAASPKDTKILEISQIGERLQAPPVAMWWEPKCRHCGQPLASRNVVVCPHCHNIT